MVNDVVCCPAFDALNVLSKVSKKPKWYKCSYFSSSLADDIVIGHHRNPASRIDHIQEVNTGRHYGWWAGYWKVDCNILAAVALVSTSHQFSTPHDNRHRHRIKAYPTSKGE